nr:hypothetical protein [Cohnella massiliensis]
MYIQYTMDQLCLPMDLEEDIPVNHLVRVVNAAVNRLDDAIFDAAYPGADETATILKCSPKSSYTPTRSAGQGKAPQCRRVCLAVRRMIEPEPVFGDMSGGFRLPTICSRKQWWT